MIRTIAAAAAAAAITLTATAAPASAVTSDSFIYDMGTHRDWTSKSFTQDKKGTLYLSHKITPCGVTKDGKDVDVKYVTRLHKWDAKEFKWVIAKNYDKKKPYKAGCGKKAKYRLTKWAATKGMYRFQIGILPPATDPDGVDPITFYGHGQLDYN